MRTFGTRLFITAATAAQAAYGQFQINPGTYDASELQDFLSGNYFSYAAIWEDQLSQAKASLPGAYAILTSIYNTDEIPETYNPTFVSELAKEMVKIGHTTVVDPQVNSNTLQFSSSTESAAFGSSTAEASDASKETSASDNNSLSKEDSSAEQTSDDVFTLSSGDAESTDTSSGSADARPALIGRIAASLLLAASFGYF
ncbi:hypothetical protein IWW55_003209 [Coemansia sp. RSA 2706]|nr:hypothetical protein IWW55_003209 [Coemansia sp. RSA 2706]